MEFFEEWKQKRRIEKANKKIYKSWYKKGKAGAKLPKSVTHPAATAGYKAGRSSIKTSAGKSAISKMLDYSEKVAGNLEKSQFGGESSFPGVSFKRKKKRRKKRKPTKKVVYYYGRKKKKKKKKESLFDW